MRERGRERQKRGDRQRKREKQIEKGRLTDRQTERHSLLESVWWTGRVHIVLWIDQCGCLGCNTRAVAQIVVGAHTRYPMQVRAPLPRQGRLGRIKQSGGGGGGGQ